VRKNGLRSGMVTHTASHLSDRPPAEVNWPEAAARGRHFSPAFLDKRTYVRYAVEQVVAVVGLAEWPSFRRFNL
jgi:hypothetical protein